MSRLLAMWMQTLLVALLWLASPAEAATFSVRFCSWVATDYGDNAAGDVWTTAGLYAPGSGFAMRVENDTLDTVLWEGWATESGTYAGCSPELQLDDGGGSYDYDVKVTSKALIGSITVKSYDDQTTADTLTALVLNNFTPTATQRYDLTPLPGDTESRWNFLALVAKGLLTEDGGISSVTLELYKDGTSPVYIHGTTGKLVLPDGYDRKFIVLHELGHFVTFGLSGSISASGNASLNDCDGNAGIVQKEYQSFAAKEGIASFYSAYVLNDHGASDDCEWQPALGVDWDLDGGIDTNNLSAAFCHGDPWSGTPDPDDRDWLRDLILGMTTTSTGFSARVSHRRRIWSTGAQNTTGCAICGRW